MYTLNHHQTERQITFVAKKPDAYRLLSDCDEIAFIRRWTAGLQIFQSHSQQIPSSSSAIITMLGPASDHCQSLGCDSDF